MMQSSVVVRRSPYLRGPIRHSSTLVIGSSGALGRSVCNALKKDYEVHGADVIRGNLDPFVHLDLKVSFLERTKQLIEETHNHGRYDAVICTAGGWTGDSKLPRNPKNAPLTVNQRLEHAQSFLSKIELMHQMNLEPAIMASLIPAKLQIYIGAAAVLGTHPGMMGYHLAKSSVHQLSQINKSICILPTTLDTKINRQNMEYSPEWVNPDEISAQIKEWLDEPNLQPHPGALIRVHRASDKLHWTLA